MLLSRCRTNRFKRSEYAGCVKWITTTPYWSVDSFIGRMQLRCRIRFHSIHLDSVRGRIRFRFRLASFVSYAFISDWRQPTRDTRQTVKFHIGSLSVIVETRFESDVFRNNFFCPIVVIAPRVIISTKVIKKNPHKSLIIWTKKEGKTAKNKNTSNQFETISDAIFFGLEFCWFLLAIFASVREKLSIKPIFPLHLNRRLFSRVQRKQFVFRSLVRSQNVKTHQSLERKEKKISS